jgi:hypothetical protein
MLMMIGCGAKMVCSICGSEEHTAENCCCRGKWNTSYPHDEKDCHCMCHSSTRKWKEDTEKAELERLKGKYGCGCDNKQRKEEIAFLKDIRFGFINAYEDDAWQKLPDSIKKDFISWVHNEKQQDWTYGGKEDQWWRAWQNYQQEYIVYLIEVRIVELEVVLDGDKYKITE